MTDAPETSAAELSPAPIAEGAVGAAETPSVRLLTDHQVNECNEQLRIEVLDSPGAGGANHLYGIRGFDTTSNPSCPFVARYGKPAYHATVLFQNGPIKESAVNGITHEALLAIIIDRMRAFQAGPYACQENHLALAHIEAAVRFLKMRTLRRTSEGTEGTHGGV